MKRVVSLVLVLLMLGWSVPARAAIGTIDQVPAATLLLPYFEVDLNNPLLNTTLFSINNASATAILAHVVIWSDLSVHMLDFNVYLTGYDVQTINLRDIIVNGNLPRTASAGQDPSPPDAISPKGPFSQDINFASCNGILPYPNLNTISPLYLPHLQQGLTGKGSPIYGGQCVGQNKGDNIARGYITVDTVNNCTTRFPGDPGYFVSGGAGDATNQNVLWGDYFYVNEAQNFAQGDTLVHIEAAPGTGVSGLQGTYAADPRTTVPGNYTFYGRYIGWNASDNREPLATTFAARYLNGGVFNGGTDLVVWRDSKVPTSSASPGSFTCSAQVGRPSWYPLGQEQIVIFDEQEHPDVPPSCTVSPCVPGQTILPFPAEAQRTHVGGPDFPVPFTFGWLFLNLNTFVPSAGNNPPADPTAAQAWVSTTHSASGRFSVGYDAIQLDNASQLTQGTPHLHVGP